MNVLARFRSRILSPRGRRQERDGGAVRLCHLVTAIGLDGLSSRVTRISNALPPEEFSTSCICLEPVADHAPRFKSHVELYALERRDGVSVGAIAEVTRNLRRLRPLLLHTHDQPSLAIGLAAARLARVPYLLHTEHRGVFDETRVPPFALRLASRLARRLTAVSSGAAGALAERLGLPEASVGVLPSGVDVDAFIASGEREGQRSALGITGQQIVIGAVGRLCPQKNHAMLLEAVALLAQDGLDVRCVIVGEGPEEEPLWMQARQLNLGRRLSLVGYVRALPSILSAMDIFVLPSMSEGFSCAALEAMACSLPVVATSVGGNLDLIRDGENGLLVPAGRPRIMARVLAQLAESASHRAALGERGLRAVRESHTLAAMVAAYRKVYLELVG